MKDVKIIYLEIIMNQLTSKTRTQKILFTLLVLMFLIPVVSFAADEVTTIGGPANVIQGLLYTIVNSLFGWMVWASGLLLNYSVKEYVVGFGFNFIDSGLGSAVNNLWVTVRDIFNLTFIFGLVYIGFKMILNSGDSNARRMLVSLILAALLVNFSLFITKTVIDFSNIAATQFAASFSSGTGTEVNYDLTDKFMQLTGLSSLWGSANKVADMPAGQGWAYIFGSLILYLVMAFVFAAGAILLIIRYVVLNIYMILSPIMFLGWVFPGFSGASQKYWSGFLQRAFFAPAYLLMLFFAAEVLKAMSFPNQDLANAFVNSGAPAAKDAFIATIPYFILTCAFLIAAIVVAQKMGAVGATNAIAIGNRLRGTAQRGLINAPTRLALNAGGGWAVDKVNNTATRSGALGYLARTNVVNRAVASARDAQLGTGTTNKTESDYKKKTRVRANETAAANARAASEAAATAAINNLATTEVNLIAALKTLGDTVKAMSKEEKDKLGYSRLIDQNIAMHLNDSDIDNLEKSGNYDAKQIKDIKDARDAGHSAVATSGSTLPVSHPLKYNAAVIDSQRNALVSGKSVTNVGKMPVDVFTTVAMYQNLTPAMLEERIRNGMSKSDAALARIAIEQHLRVPLGTDPSLYPAKNQWTKWAQGNSTHAAYIFS